MTIISMWTIFINAALALVLVTAGLFAFRRTYSKTVADIQERVITAQREENATLSSQILTLTQQVDKLQSTITTIQHLLRDKGILVVVDGDYVTLRSTEQRRTTTTRIPPKRRPIQDKETEGGS